MKHPFMVSVRLMTYNQEAFIRETMESIMMQRVKFPVEVVVGDDFSTDRTLDIIKSFNSTDKIVIRVLERAKGDVYHQKRQQLGRLYNFSNIIENCNGKYIALLDGDDYWSDPDKLQKQVDFLEADPDCILCHHWQKIVEIGADGNWMLKEAPTEGQGYYPLPKATVAEIFSNKLRAKSRTVMFRNALIEFPSWFYKVAYGDVPLSMILGKHGNFGFINEPMAVYRLTGQGVSTAGSGKWSFVYNHFLEWVRIWEYGHLFYKGKYEKEVMGTILYFYTLIVKKYDYNFQICIMLGSYSLFKSKLPFFFRLRVFFNVLYIFMRKIKGVKNWLLRRFKLISH